MNAWNQSKQIVAQQWKMYNNFRINSDISTNWKVVESDYFCVSSSGVELVVVYSFVENSEEKSQ